MFNIKKGLAPIYLSQNFTRVNHEYSTRGSLGNYTVPRPIGVTSGNFNYNGAKLWNALPPWIKSIRDKSKFKKKVRSHLRVQKINPM